ncbi:hypothetical protein [Limibacterium fermenti]|uniref:hypothetical protein n=1 Tax=Limibacterium fermenti TaxID=3229863 RepID=UPI003A68FE1F
MNINKSHILLLSLLLNIGFAGCGKNDAEDFFPSGEFLKETSWVGTIMVEEKGEIVRRGNISFVLLQKLKAIIIYVGRMIRISQIECILITPLRTK